MRFDLLVLDKRGYTFESHAAKKVGEACDKKEIPFKKIYFSEGTFKEYLYYVEEEPPTFMLSFSPLLPFETPFCDLVGIPQGIWLENSLSEAPHFLTSKQGRLFIPRETALPKTHYLAHGVEKISRREPLFDLVFFSPLVDTMCLKEQWKEFFTPTQITALEEGVLTEVFPSSLFCEKSHLGFLMAAFEEYLKAKRAYPVITSSRYAMHVFGEHIGSNWYQRLPNPSLIHLHAPIPYTERLKVWASSLIALLDPLDAAWSAQIAAAGCLPLRIDTPHLDAQIESFLIDSKKREKALESYREKIHSLTWENQTDQLLEYFL